MSPENVNLIALAAILAAMSLLPLFLMVCTAFLKVVVVLMIVRSALGVQQVPPNMVIYSIALVATIFIMAPVGYEVVHNFEDNPLDFINTDRLKNGLLENLEPIKLFMVRNADPDMVVHLVDVTLRIWPSELSAHVGHNDLVIIIPAFMLSELQRGFEIGFLVYIPFIVIDLIVSNLLLALGMQMVSPMTISLPLKILLFVMISGWTHLLDSLFYSYQ